MQSSCATRYQSLCPTAKPAARPCHGGPHWLAALPPKMTHPTPWRVCPPWGWVGATSAGLFGPSPCDWTLCQSPHACQRRGIHWRECFRLESGPNPHRHRSPPGHRLRLQRHPHEPLHTHLHGGHPPPHGRAQICCLIPSHC